MGLMSKLSYFLIFVLFVTLGVGYFELNQMLSKYTQDSDAVKCIYDSDKLIVDSSAGLKLAEKELGTEYSYDKYVSLLGTLDQVGTRKLQLSSECSTFFDTSAIDTKDIKNYLSESNSEVTSDSINKFAVNLQQQRLNIFTEYDLLEKKY